MKLKGLITSKGVPLGTTKDGAEWCMKALHPAEDAAVVGVPDGTAHSSLVVSYTASQAITAPGSDTWAVDIICSPNPLDLAGIHASDPAPTNVWTNVFNRQLETATGTHLAAFQALSGQVEQYRCLWYSATLHQVATATTDSGIITAVQYPWVPKHPVSAASSTTVYTEFECYPDQVRTWGQLTHIPTYYMGEARDGCYLPLKLTDYHWQSTNAYMRHLNAEESSLYVNPTSSILLPGAGVSTQGFPYAIESTEQSGAQAIYTYPSCGDMKGHIALIGLHPDASLQLVIRAGFEFRCTPGTPLSSFMKMAPITDHVALAAYANIARELKDAYPEEYNSLGSLLAPIWNIAKTVLPAMFPALGPVLTAGEGLYKAAAPVVKTLSQKIPMKKKKPLVKKK